MTAPLVVRVPKLKAAAVAVANAALAGWGIRDDGLELPKLGSVAWSEIQSLEVDGSLLGVTSRRGDTELPLGRTNVNAKTLRAEIAAHSGGSWSAGRWTSRAS